MLKTILYVTATLFGVGMALQTPVWGVVLAVLTYLFNPQLLASAIPDFRYQLWSAAALALTVLTHKRQGDGLGTEGRWLLVVLWLYTAVALLSAVWAVHSSEIAVEWAYDFAKTTFVVALFPLAIRSEKCMSIVVWACLIGASHAAFMHVIGTRLAWVPPSVGKPGYDEGVLIEYQGMVVAMFVPLFVMHGFYAKKLYARCFCWALLPLALDSIVNTYMRTVFVSLLLELVLIFLFLPWRVAGRLLPVLAFAGALFLFVFTPQTYWDRMSTIKTPTKEGSANSRFVIGEASVQMFQDYPLGVGYRNYPDMSPRYLPPEYLTLDEGIPRRAAHNSYFSVLCELGVVGFALWATVILGTMWLFRQLRKGMDGKHLSPLDVSSLGFEIGFYGWLIGGFTNSFHEVDPAYWFMAFAVVLTRLKSRQRRLEQEEQQADAQEGDEPPYPTEEYGGEAGQAEPQPALMYLGVAP
jgi:O-antigen ligase